MAEFVWKPLDEEDVDIHTDESATLNAHLGARKATFAANPDDNQELVTSGEDFDQAQEILKLIDPYIKQDGGEVTLLGIKNGWVQLKMGGACGDCGASASTLLLVEESICEEMPHINGVEAVQD